MNKAALADLLKNISSFVTALRHEAKQLYRNDLPANHELNRRSAERRIEAESLEKMADSLRTLHRRTQRTYRVMILSQVAMVALFCTTFFLAGRLFIQIHERETKEQRTPSIITPNRPATEVISQFLMAATAGLSILAGIISCDSSSRNRLAHEMFRDLLTTIGEGRRPSSRPHTPSQEGKQY